MENETEQHMENETDTGFVQGTEEMVCGEPVK